MSTDSGSAPVGTTSKWNHAIASWKEEALIRRADHCRRLLYFHGLLSERENEAVLKRIRKANAEATND